MCKSTFSLYYLLEMFCQNSSFQAIRVIRAIVNDVIAINTNMYLRAILTIKYVIAIRAIMDIRATMAINNIIRAIISLYTINIFKIIMTSNYHQHRSYHHPLDY